MGWTLLTLGVLVAGVWGASGWLWLTRRFDAMGANYTVAIQYGTLFCMRASDTDGRDAWNLERYGSSVWRWSFGWGHDVKEPNAFHNFGAVQFSRFSPSTGPALKRIELILWPVPFLLWAAGMPLLHSGILARRRANAGLCKKCDYSLAGIAPGAPCPECGKASTESTVSTSASGS
jgi:hypothetical protein